MEEGREEGKKEERKVGEKIHTLSRYIVVYGISRKK
jgi:hypothetical protein